MGPGRRWQVGAQELLAERRLAEPTFEASRELSRWAAERGPFVRATARRSAFSLGHTHESAARLRALGSRCVEASPQIGLLDDEFEQFAGIRREPKADIRFLSVCKLIHWKGCDISLRAFARANIAGAEYWLIGDGPDRQRLEKLMSTLGISDRVRFFGPVTRQEVLSSFQDCDVLLHPSLHDGVARRPIEAIATGLPVICLDLGGPAMQVTANSGFKISARNPDQASREIAAAMTELAQDERIEMLSEFWRARARETRLPRELQGSSTMKSISR